MRRTILLKPMRAGASGYVRLQSEAGRTLLQLHARGLEPGIVRMFWYQSGQTARELGERQVNPHGEASLEVEAPADALSPQQLQAVMLLGGEDHPAPLLIGLCVQQSAGSLLDAKNAALALCERLSRPAAPPPAPQPALLMPPPKPALPPLGREIFLPAIDPLPYMPASGEGAAPTQPSRRSAAPAWRLRPLRWPKGFEKLRPFFERALPCRLFDLPGWRFVQAGGTGSLWIGYRQQDGRVCRIAYALRTDLPPADGKYQPVRGLDGMQYQVMWQRV